MNTRVASFLFIQIILIMDFTYSQNWARTFGTTNSEGSFFIQQTLDGGYMIGGAFGNPSDTDIWVIKLDSAGSVQWEKTYGTSFDDYGRAFHQTLDGGYIAAGGYLFFR